MKRWLNLAFVASCAMIFLACSLGIGTKKQAANVGIIPAPAKMELLGGSFPVGAKTRIVLLGDTKPLAARFLSAGLKERTGMELPILRSGKAVKGAIALELSKDASGNPEGYKLTVKRDGVLISAPTETGLFYGTQSVLQMADARQATPAKKLGLPCVRIEDQPRYGYRGLMLDESRHFFGKEVVKQTLDQMAYLKMNRFHWHLTDTPGWRIEIKKYPKLTEVGSIGNNTTTETAPEFYTQDEIREIVAYAAARQIMIIPEVDMPGHANAAVRSYPELAGGISRRHGHFVFNPAKEETYRFLEDVLSEVAQLFPAPFIHLGGDEVSFGNQDWKTDPEILKFGRERGLNNPIELEHYFVKRMADYINKLGKTTMGWDEITSSGVSRDGSVLFWWRHNMPNALKVGLKEGYPVVLCPRTPCYFDFIQDKRDKVGRTTLLNSIDKVYDFPDPIIAKYAPAGTESQIMGIEACVWSEDIAGAKRMQYMVYPRIAALAEACWTPKAGKHYEGFMSRLGSYLCVLDQEKIYYYDPFNPDKTPEAAGPGKAVKPY
ncbi:beta-N-acetylhexosaminidase [bacterium]|nr:beta-N-acetylhexosaminidase [bacterium]